MSRDYVSKGFKFQESFQKEYVPVFTYKVKDVEIIKAITFEYSKNTVAIYYKVINKNHETKLTLAPLLNFRNYHYTNKDHDFKVEQIYRLGKLEVILDNNIGNTIYIKVPGAKYIEQKNNSFKNMFYIEEEKRGFEAEENHAIPGIFEIDILPNEEKEISFICSLEEDIDELNAKELIDNEIIRLNEIFNDSLLIDNRKVNKTEEQLENDRIIKNLIISTDSFLTYRPKYREYSILAGYPWFLDWSRDTLISFEGVLLVSNRFNIARSVLKTLVRDIRYGLVPNGYSDVDDEPLYNSVDASLLLFEQVQKYIDYTNDYKFIKDNLYYKLESIIENYSNGINYDDNNIYLDIDGLLVSGTEYTQLTWMDAKVNGKPVTPRNGKAVEINALWYNALVIMKKLAIKFGKKEEAKVFENLADRCKESFNEKFYNSKKRCLYDVIGDDKIRPNQLFALSLSNPVIDVLSEEAKSIIDVVEKKLITPYGLKTLAKGEENYTEKYEGNVNDRDSIYHQGISWPWLLGLYYDALINIYEVTKDKEMKQELEIKIKDFKLSVKEVFSKELYERGCICGIAEIYDSCKPYTSRGTINQAWSVAEIFRIIK